MIHLITGATGNVGSLVVKRLLERGEQPRVLARDAAKARARFGDRVDIFTGDFADPTTLKAALTAVEAFFLVTSGPGLAAYDAAAAAVAKAAGVKRLVKLSSHDVHQMVGTGVWHAEGEVAIRASGIGFTFVQPSGFMSNALYWADAIRTEGVVRSSTGDGRIPFIHPQDIADVATEALTSRSHTGQELTITGPEALSYPEMTAKIAAATRKKIRFQELSDEEERRQLLGYGESAEMVEAHLSIYRAIRGGRLAYVTDTVEKILRRKPATFDEWLHENLAAFC
jgi:uncharacterized protein YbjT (DUF2867 family)